MYWNEVFHGHQNVFNALLIGTVVISFLPSIYLFFVQRKVEQVPTS
ncbi:putative membrane protein [Streptococcus mitis]|nr:putative membrane protein [Streptococcus mitis]